MKIDRANPKRKLKKYQVDGIVNFFQHYNRENISQIHDDFPFLKQLPKDLKAQLLLYLFRDFINNFKCFFSGCEEFFIYEFLVNLKPITFEPKSDVIPTGQTADMIYLINKGEIQIGQVEQ